MHQLTYNQAEDTFSASTSATQLGWHVSGKQQDLINLLGKEAWQQLLNIANTQQAQLFNVNYLVRFATIMMAG